MKVKFSISVKCFMRTSRGVSPFGGPTVSASGKAEICGAPVLGSLKRKTLDSFSVDAFAIAIGLSREVEELLRELALTPRGHASATVAAPPASKASFRNCLLLGDLSDAVRFGLATLLISLGESAFS